MIKILIAALTLTFFTAPANAETPTDPILVVDKCPEFCPPGIKGPIKKDNSKKKVCTMALIPVPNKKHWYWTDGCKTKMVYMPPTKRGNK